MTKLALNKSSLNKEKKSLTSFNRYLPALELKRQQLMIEKKKAMQAISEIAQRIEQIEELVERNLPMLSFFKKGIDKLVRLESYKVLNESIVGIRVPKLDHIEIKECSYSYLSTPHWIDYCVDLLKEALKLKIQQQVCKERYEIISYAVKVTSQRVNLFSKVMIPQAQSSIKKIQIYLSDQDRASVLNAKLSKEKVMNQKSKKLKVTGV